MSLKSLTKHYEQRVISDELFRRSDDSAVKTFVSAQTIQSDLITSADEL